MQYRKLAELKKLDRNPRTIKEDDMARLVESLRKNKDYFEARPLILSNRTGELVILAGNQRYEAAKIIGMDEVPTFLIEGLTEAREREIIIRDNVANGEWDYSELANSWDEKDLLDWGVPVWDTEDLEDENEGEAKEDDYDIPDEVNTDIVRGDLFEIGPHRLLCGDATDKDAWGQLMPGEEADLVITDPPYNVDYTGKTKDALKIENDKKNDADFYEFLLKFYRSLAMFTKRGGVWYVWHADSEGANFRRAMAAAGIPVRQCLIWVKNSLVMGRQDYHWQHEPCQPAGTMIRTPSGEVPIENLKDGDVVLSYDKYSGTIVGMRDGISIRVGKRDYSGELYGVHVSGKLTWTTDTHKFSVRFKDNKRKTYCTYLMRKDNWWRIGLTETYNARGFGLKTRFRQEGAHEAWILTTHENRMEAQCMEQLLAVKYGIPMTHWNVDRGIVSPVRTEEMISWIYDHLDLGKLVENAKKLLLKFGRRIEYPLIDNNSAGDKFSCRVTAQIMACNLIPGIMDIPVPYDKWDTKRNKTFDWEPLNRIERKDFSGIVYSLDVEKYQHYIADGIVTHNCLYGWKEGAAHGWYSDRKQTTLLYFDRPSRNAEHPTMKPVPLISYQMTNSSKQGDIVADGFGGSGTTMVAAHQIGRKCRMMELDPKYCQVIIDRMRKLDPDIKIIKNEKQA